MGNNGSKLSWYFQKVGVFEEKPSIWKLLLLFSFVYMILYGANEMWLEMHHTYNPFDNSKEAFLQTETAKTHRIHAAIMATLSSFFIIPLFSFIGAFLAWVLASFFQSETTFKRMYALFIACSIPLILGILAETIYHLFLPEVTETPFHLAFFIPSTGLWEGALQAIDLFEILFFIMLTLGLKQITKLNWMRTSFITLFFFAVVFFFHFSRFALGSVFE